ncbi:RraA family protein [Caballeronia telluris]|uniref:hypothetical protein n=1 Tax=Caballeronia telluris TaxID=326475 RepID=UPI000F74245D|nr:hypothetical protein [Caballeronia telluris]
MADSDGVIVVPNRRAGEIVNLAVERKNADDETRRKIKGGESVLSIKGLRRVLEEKGVVEVKGTWLDATAGS